MMLNLIGFLIAITIGLLLFVVPTIGIFLVWNKMKFKTSIALIGLGVLSWVGFLTLYANISIFD